MNGLKQEKADKLCGMYNELLANLAVSRQNVYHFHWNMKGTLFFTMHPQFGDLYGAIGDRIDAVAERIKALSDTVLPEHRFSEYLKLSTIKETTTSGLSSMVGAVIADIETIITIERAIIKEAQTFGDEATITMVGDFLVSDEKALWMYNAFKKI